ncbi:MAG TPA: hypothetical protein VI356_15775 [Myxococcales bacterium]
MQGRLRREELSVEIESECGHCGRALRATVDQDLRSKVHSRGARPLLFEPEVDWTGFRGPNIIDVY